MSDESTCSAGSGSERSSFTGGGTLNISYLLRLILTGIAESHSVGFTASCPH